jgi:peptide methionine sulfoxide reductase MsrA
MSERGSFKHTQRSYKQPHLLQLVFWRVKEAFRQVKDVKSTVIGYTRGLSENSTYKNVYTDKTGHAGQYS